MLQNRLKRILISKGKLTLPCLYLPDPKVSKIIETGTSEIGYGGILK